MKMRTTLMIAAGLVGPSAAMAQPTIDWSTIDCGGGTVFGGTFQLSGTIGQFDASTPLTGGTFQVTGGFWPVSVAPAGCYPDCDGSGGLSPADFTCFLGKFRAGSLPFADCDNSGGLSPADFTCFLGKFRAGCP